MSNYTRADIINMLPIFEVDDHDRIFFKDKNISELELHITIEVNEITVVPLLFQLRVIREYTFQLHYWLYDRMGWIMVNNDIIIPDSACMGLYDHGIDVESLMLVDGKNLYDRVAIERRSLIQDIIQ